MSDELKPCPFCGGEAEIGSRRNRFNNWKPDGFIPRCKDTKCLGRIYRTFPSKQSAIQKWNRRMIDVSTIYDFIEQQPKFGEWIPCSDRLPEQTIKRIDGVYSSETAIVTIKNEEGVSSSVDFLIDGKWACSAADDEVIAWMPLPEPYGGGSLMDIQKEVNLNDLIKALRCLASGDLENNCYIDNYNSNSAGQRMSCYGSPETIKCPYNQQTYGVCFDDGECNEWLEDASELLKELQQYHQIGTIEECRKAVEVKKEITEIVDRQLIAGKNNYKEVYDCFHEIVKYIQDNY